MSSVKRIECVGQMFSNFTNVWTIVGLARDLKRAAPLAMRGVSERVVFFRAAGRARALIDQCPYRGVGLSFDNQLFVQCSIPGFSRLNVGRPPGSSTAASYRREAAAP